MPTEPTPRMIRRLRWSGGLIVVGLLVEAGSLLGLNHPTAFLGFVIAGGTLVIAGIVLYLYSLLP